MVVTCSTRPSTSLTSIPPELLLRIISFLPNTSAFLPLTQTSSGLRHFFSLHASKICNEFILSHFPFETALLRSQIQDGWLVPTHCSIRREEALILERKRRRCGVCRGKARPILQPRVDALVISDYEADCSPSPCVPRYCNGRHDAELGFALSSPGPLYLGFLEEYSSDIRIRGEIAGFLNAERTALSSPFEDDGSTERDRKEREFEWQISTYAVRPYLRKLDALLVDDGGYGIDFDAASSSSTTTLPVKAKISLGRMLLAKTGLGRIFPFRGRLKVERRERMFGEIAQNPRENRLLYMGSQSGLGRDAMSAVLLWNIKLGGVGGPAPPAPSSIYDTQECPLLGEKKQQNSKNLIADLKVKAKKLEQRVRLGLVTSSERMMSLVRQRCFGKQKRFAMLR